MTIDVAPSHETTPDTDTDLAVHTLARRLYLHYCQVRDFSPHASPYTPPWALDYARLAVKAYGFDQDGLETLMADVKGDR